MSSSRPFLEKVISSMQEMDQKGITSIAEADNLLSTIIPDCVRRGADLRKEGDGKFHFRMNLSTNYKTLPALLDYIDMTHNGHLFPYNEIVPFQQHVLFITGTLSTMFRKGRAQGNEGEIDNDVKTSLKQLFPNSELVEVEGAGHFIRETHAEQLFLSIVSYFNNIFKYNA